jgi:hypothetical protein
MVPTSQGMLAAPAGGHPRPRNRGACRQWRGLSLGPGMQQGMQMSGFAHQAAPLSGLPVAFAGTDVQAGLAWVPASHFGPGGSGEGGRAEVYMRVPRQALLWRGSPALLGQCVRCAACPPATKPPVQPELFTGLTTWSLTWSGSQLG